MRRRADACVGLITHAQDVLLDVVARPTLGSSIARIESLSQQLREVPLESVPDFRLTIAVRQASSAMSALHADLSARKTSISYGISRNEMAAREDVKRAATELDAAYALAIEAANELQSPTIRQRLAHWRFKRKNEKAQAGTH
ncbi:hypothetical protein C9J98_04520 [Stenotrophomonas panacihumi]|nr:hypothetical protein C9J98_04520 [Stenotrophomonas panacihumi]